MEYSMYFCPDCKKIYKVKGNDKIVKCKNCENVFLRDLKISDDTWNTYSQRERQEIINKYNSDRRIVKNINKSSNPKPVEKTKPVNIPKSTITTVERKYLHALKCEMCDSVDVVKDGSYYICQNCGTKYTVETAKKMMTEGNIDISGSTVKIDNSSKTDSLYKLARRAKEEDNNEDAEKYYSQILVENPDDWEAQFYNAYYHAYSCKIGEIAIASSKVANSITSTFKLLRETLDEEERKVIFNEIRSRIIILGSNLYNAALKYAIQFKNTYAGSKVMSEVTLMVRGILSMYEVLAKELMTEGDNENAVDLYIQCIERSNLRGCIIYSETQRNAIIKKIKEIRPGYSLPARTQGCYVATAVYGSYDCPEVWTLRRYRDYRLAKTCYGRTFIRIYYAISPTLVRWFGHTDWFKFICRINLDKMIRKLQYNGFESTPYEDVKW